MEPIKFLVICYKVLADNTVDSWTHDYAPPTLDEALHVGHELTRDFVADGFKVTRIPTELR